MNFAVEKIVCISLLVGGLAACGAEELSGDVQISLDGSGTAQTTTAPTTDPATDPTTDPTTDPATDPTTDPTTDPVTDPVTDPTPDTGGNDSPADSTISLHRLGDPGTHLVTMGIPFAPGALSDTDQLRVVDQYGSEVSIYVEPTLNWHFKASPNDTIRAVKVQFKVNMPDAGTNEMTYSFDLNGRNTANDLSEAPVENGLVSSPIAGKAGTMQPKVMGILPPAWLAASQIIPPFKPTQDDAHKVYWDGQQEWVQDLNYEQSTLANWLFDRATSMYKGCMRNGKPSCYQEAFTSFRFWANQLKRDGTAGGTSCRGGPTMGGQYKICDGKYMYLENFKIHWALTGDDSLFDRQLLTDIATSSWENWQAIPVRSPRTEQDGYFTERGAGITLLTQISAYEMLETAETLNRIQTSLDNLHALQNSPPDGYAAQGAWRHSWDAHEGAENYATGDVNDRRFSPWMSENIVDALWHANFVVNDERSGDMIRKMADALETWGFADSQGYVDRFGMDLIEYRQLRDGSGGWNHGCNDGTQVLYSASSLADAEDLIHTAVNDGYYSDMHNPEIILILALGHYFETDADRQQDYLDRINNIKNNFLNSYCASVDNTQRLFNWQNRGNAWGTHLWVMDNS